MKIAYIYDAVYPWIKGGAKKRIYEIGRRLADKHEVHWYGIGWWLKDNINETVDHESCTITLTEGVFDGKLMPNKKCD